MIPDLTWIRIEGLSKNRIIIVQTKLHLSQTELTKHYFLFSLKKIVLKENCCLLKQFFSQIDIRTLDPDLKWTKIQDQDPDLFGPATKLRSTVFKKDWRSQILCTVHSLPHIHMTQPWI